MQSDNTVPPPFFTAVMSERAKWENWDFTSPDSNELCLHFALLEQCRKNPGKIEGLNKIQS